MQQRSSLLARAFFVLMAGMFALSLANPPLAQAESRRYYPDDQQPVYRLYNPYTTEHLLTIHDNERSTLLASGWNDEGVAWVTAKSSGTPVYRLFNHWTGEHFYTISENERYSLISQGWNDEGPVFYSDDARRDVVYRLYNPYAPGISSHLYTASRREYDQLRRQGWIGEYIQFYCIYL